MAYDLSNTVTKVLQRIKDTGYSNTEVKNYINDTQNDVFNEYRLPFMEASQDYTLTASDADITSGNGLPTNYVQGLNLILNTDGYEKRLVYTPKEEMDMLFPNAEDTSAYPTNVPNRWYDYAQTIKVHPVPAAAYAVTLEYYKKPTELSSDSNVPEIPSEFQELLVVGAAYRILQIKDNYDQAAILENKYNELLQKLVVKFSQKQVGQVSRIRLNRRSIAKRYY